MWRERGSRRGAKARQQPGDPERGADPENRYEKRASARDRNADDIRGYAVRDANGIQLGTVAELLVDPVTEYVTELKLTNGK